MKLYSYSGESVPVAQPKINCKIVAHRGYFAESKANTIASFIEASEAGFTWIEIDIRKTADNIYVMAHDADVTLYNNGSSESVTIANVKYADIKTYTWDEAGKYKISTLQAVFNTMNLYDMNLIIDLKSGSRDDIVQMAAAAGIVDRIMLSFGGGYAPSTIINSDVIKRHPEMPLRIYPTTYENLVELQEGVVNPIYLDINADSAGNKKLLAIAIACGMPIIFSGCKDTNAAIWCVLASGCMHHSANKPIDWWLGFLDNDYDKATEIEVSADSVSISVGSAATVTATSSLNNDAAGYIYAYTLDPRIAEVTQDTFGNSVSISIAGMAAGATTLRLFDGTGSQVEIPVTVTAAGS